MILNQESNAIKQYGGPDVSEMGETAIPFIKGNELPVKVKGSSVNPVECFAGLFIYR